MRMTQEVKDKWVAALRSGEYEQGTGYLKSDDGKYCCLGVLQMCTVGEVDKEDSVYGKAEYRAFPDPQFWSTLDPLYVSDVSPAFGPKLAYTLAEMNDGMHDDVVPGTFDEIANYIEEHVEIIK